MIDTHAHIYAEEFVDDLDVVIAESRELNIEAILMPNIDVSTIARLHEVEDLYPKYAFAMMGLHPCYVKPETYKKELANIELQFKDRQYIAVGEIGIDMYWDKSTYDIQKEVFIRQVEWSRDMNIPVAIHSRDSLDDTIGIIEKLQNGGLKGVFHCFNGTVEQGKRIEAVGFAMGVGGVVTFKNAGVDKVIEDMNIDQLVLETDAPYLAPTPKRGKRNSPTFLPYIATKLAECHGLTLDQVIALTNQNASKLFNLTP